MMIYWILLMVIFPSFVGADEVNLDFFQDDYDVKLDILEISSYNKSHFKYAEAGLVWYNRTLRAISAKFQYKYDPRNNMFVDVQLYKMMSNEYRFFPLTFKVNVCTEYNRNSFNIKKMLSTSSNMDLCNLKGGFPYVIDKLILDVSKLPPHLPRGSYKFVQQFLFNSEFQTQADGYFRIVDKPTAWKKLPSERPRRRTP